MKIDTDELIGRIANVCAARQDASERKAKAERDELKANLDKVASCRGELKEIGKVVRFLYDTGTIQNVRKFGVDRKFLSEGIDHRIGFSPYGWHLWGICGGGCSGSSLFVDLDMGRFVACEWNGEAKYLPVGTDELADRWHDNYGIRCKAAAMADRITAYIAEVTDFVNSLEGAAKR